MKKNEIKVQKVREWIKGFCYDLATTGLILLVIHATIRKNLSIFFRLGVGALGLLLSKGFGCSFFFEWFFFCILRWLEIPLVIIVLTFTLQATFQGMSRVLTLLLALFPKLAKLFYFYKGLSLLCSSLVLFLQLIGIGFGLSLAPFWGCLSLVSCAFICFIGSFEPSRMR